MKEYQSLAHTRWDCKYHVVFIPKRRKKKLFGALRRHLGEVFRELAKHKEVEVVEGLSDAGSRAHVPEHSAEVRGVDCGGVHQRQEYDHDCPAVRGTATELHGRSVLGQRVFRFNHRAGRRDGKSVHPEPRGTG